MIADEPAPLRHSQTLRTFVALVLEPNIRDMFTRTTAELRQEAWARDVRWVRPESLHLTLRFLGELAAENVPGLLDALSAGAKKIEPFSCALGGLSFFPSEARPRVVVAEVAKDHTLDKLAAAVEETVVEAGFPAETRRFRPHITLGRFRRTARRGLELAADRSRTLEGVPLAVSDVVLFCSQLGQGGARYTELGRAELGSTAV